MKLLYSLRIKRLDVWNLVITNVCNSRCLLCNYWKLKRKKLLNISLVRSMLPYINKYKTRKIYVTGGEPLLHPQFYEIAKTLREGTTSKITLCTNGFLISKFIDNIYQFFDAYIISFDACTETTYKSIRGVNWFRKILEVPKLIKSKNPDAYIAFTCVIQKCNYRYLEKILKLANSIGCDFMGFTLPTLVPHGFGWRRIPKRIKEKTLLTENELSELEEIIERLIKLNEKLRIKIIQPPGALREYVSQLGYEINICPPPPVECPIPFQEIVIDESGFVRPCYILPPIEKFKKNKDPVNSPKLLEFRRKFLKHTPNSCYSCYIRLLHRHLKEVKSA